MAENLEEKTPMELLYNQVFEKISVTNILKTTSNFKIMGWRLLVQGRKDDQYILVHDLHITCSHNITY